MQTQISLDKRFNDMPQDYKTASYKHFYDLLPIMREQEEVIDTFGLEASLEGFENLLETGGVRLLKDVNENWKIWLFNLFTHEYEDVTDLKSILTAERNENENQSY